METSTPVTLQRTLLPSRHSQSLAPLLANASMTCLYGSALSNALCATAVRNPALPLLNQVAQLQLSSKGPLASSRVDWYGSGASAA